MKLEKPRSKGQDFQLASEGQQADEGFLSPQFASPKCDNVNACSEIIWNSPSLVPCAKSERVDNCMDTERGGRVGWIEREGLTYIYYGLPCWLSW